MNHSIGIDRAILLAIATLAILTSSGCTTITAALTPPAVDDESVELGMDRREVERLIDATSHQTEFENGTLVYYRYEDQANPVYRAPFYFVFGPADFVLYPIEMGIQRLGQRWATGLYDLKEKLVLFVSENAVGHRVIELGGSPGQTKPRKRRHTLLGAVLGSRFNPKESDHVDNDDE